MCTFDEMVTAYFGVLVWSPVLSPSHQHPQAQPFCVTMESKKICRSSFNKALGTLVGTKTHWLIQNSRAMLSRQPTVSLLYVLVTAFANRESSHVKLTPGNDCHTLVKKVYRKGTNFLGVKFSILGETASMLNFRGYKFSRV